MTVELPVFAIVTVCVVFGFVIGFASGHIIGARWFESISRWRVKIIEHLADSEIAKLREAELQDGRPLANK